MKLKPPAFRSIEQMVVATASMVQPPERLRVSEAAEKYRYLDNPGSYVGKWDNRKAPYLIEPMDELKSLDFTGLVFVAPARTGKSDTWFNWFADTVICDPADMMIVHMSKDVARDWSKGDLAKMMRHSKEVGSRLAPGRQNDNVHDKNFLSGMRLLVKWPSLSEVSGKTVRYVSINDYDRIPNADDVDKEGPLFDLARKRTTSFKRFGMTFAESSPGREISDPKWFARSLHEAPPTNGGILELYNRGDRRRWYWKCLYCREAFEPDFGLLNYPDSADFMEAAEMVTLRCPHCGQDHEPSQKPELQEHERNARWIKDGMLWHKDGSITGKPIRTDIASFWMKGPAAIFQTWESLVFSYLQAKKTFDDTGNESPLKKTVTADQGRAWMPTGANTDRLPEELQDRALDWGGSKEEPVVPPDVRFLVTTVDVQAGSKAGFVVQTQGYGPGGDVYLIDYYKLRKSARLDEAGDPLPLDPASYPEDWQVLVEAVIERTYPLSDASGRRMAIKKIGCDSGGAAGVTPKAYEFWRWLRDKHPGGHHRRFQLIKGEPSKTAPRTRLGYPDSQRKDRHAGSRGDVPVLFVNSNLMKDQISGMLGRVDPGFGMVQFPIWTESFIFSQLTAEVRNAKGQWENSRKKRNEAFDLLYYAAALTLQPDIRIEQMRWDDPPGWAREWDENDLVLSPAIENRPFVRKVRQEFDLSKIADALA